MQGATAAEVARYYQHEVEQDVTSLLQTINAAVEVLGATDHHKVAVARCFIESARALLVSSIQ